MLSNTPRCKVMTFTRLKKEANTRNDSRIDNCQHASRLIS